MAQRAISGIVAHHHSGLSEIAAQFSTNNDQSYFSTIFLMNHYPFQATLTVLARRLIISGKITRGIP